MAASASRAGVPLSRIPSALSNGNNSGPGTGTGVRGAGVGAAEFAALMLADGGESGLPSLWRTVLRHLDVPQAHAHAQAATAAAVRAHIHS
jgi:hypothetical protein